MLQIFATGNRARVARGRAECPDQLDYTGIWCWLQPPGSRMGLGGSPVGPTSRADQSAPQEGGPEFAMRADPRGSARASPARASRRGSS